MLRALQFYLLLMVLDRYSSTLCRTAVKDAIVGHLSKIGKARQTAPAEDAPPPGTVRAGLSTQGATGTAPAQGQPQNASKDSMVSVASPVRTGTGGMI